MLPIVKWPGGKRRELSNIVPALPHYKRYFEPFFGGGAVFFNELPLESYINDSHAELIKLYRLIQKRDKKFKVLLDDFIAEWNRTTAIKRADLYYQARERYNSRAKMDTQKILDFWILRELAYGGMFRFNAKGGFNVPFGGSYREKNMSKKADLLWSRDTNIALKNTSFHQDDFEQFMGRFHFNKDDFLFLDPPYHCEFTKYGEDDFSEDSHERLANILPTLKAKFMLVIQRTDFVDDIYCQSEYTIQAYDKKYSFNIRGRNSQSVEHILITNYE